jgi:hypothetical protein
MPERFVYADLADWMAREGWGRSLPTGSTREEAARALLPVDGQTAVGLALLRRLDRLAAALGGQKPIPPDLDERASLDVPPEGAVLCPTARPGDLFYSCEDLEAGVVSLVVVQVRGDGHVVLAYCHEPEEQPCRTQWLLWLREDHCPTPAEALRRAAANDIAWHTPRLDLAHRVLTAIAAGDDLTAFLAGVDVDEETPPPS